jgi:hypothetical protein
VANLQDFVAELKRRRVFRALVGWGIFTFAVLLLGLGVLRAIPGLAWYFFSRTSAGRTGTARPVGGSPSVAVLPFANLSGDAAQDYFADGMTEEITGKLSPAWTAMALAQLGENDRALEALDVALSRGYRDVPSLLRSRWHEPLRKDRRFAPLLAR